MKFRIIPELALIGMLSITSCMQDHPNSSDVQKEIKVSASIEGATTSQAKTRASNSTWDDADAIGIFMKKNGTTLSSTAFAKNAKYVTEGSGNFSPTTSNEIYFPFNDDKVDFIAYYPHTNSLDELNYLVDVSNQNTLPNIDLLYSNNAKGINASKGSVELKFTHQLSKVILNISMLDNTQQNFTGLTAQITNVNTTASFSLIDGTLANESESKDVSFNMSTDGKSAQAILLPASSLESMSLVLTLEGISYSLNLSEAKSITSFVKSTKHTLNITLKPGESPEIESMTATIEDWVEGPTEDFIADEDSSYTPPGKPGEGDGDDEEDLNGGEDDQYVGDGSFEKPFTVEQVQIMNPTKDKWVKGYIVGQYPSYSNDSINTNPATFSNHLNVAIASSPHETNYQNTFRIDFSDNALIGDNVDLNKKSENIRKSAYFYGDISKSNRDEKLILKPVNKVFIDGKLYE